MSTGFKNKFLFYLPLIKFVLIAPFAVGTLINIKGIDIIINEKNYVAGTLRVESFDTETTGKSGSSSISALGHIDSIRTSISLGQVTSPEVHALVVQFQQTGSLLLPVWFRPDGKSTIRRTDAQKSMPIDDIWFKVVRNFVGLNGPLIIVWMMGWVFKKQKNTSSITKNESVGHSYKP